MPDRAVQRRYPENKMVANDVLVGMWPEEGEGFGEFPVGEHLLRMAG